MSSQTGRPAGAFEATARSNAHALGLEVPPALVEALAERVAALVAERVAAPAGPEPWLDVEAAARHLACRTHRVYDLVASGRLRCAKDGRRSLFRREWLDAVLEDESAVASHLVATPSEMPHAERDHGPNTAQGKRAS